VLGPFWVWLLTGETPGLRTLAGGALVLGALLGHLLWQLARPRPAPLRAERGGA
jgi:drug/metabolite transporter (DMT)-like permease